VRRALDAGRVNALARGDFLERARRPAFLITLGVGLWAAWFFTPPRDAGYTTIDLGGHRGLYGSAWTGSAVALLAAVFFSLVGFYIVRGAVAGDRRSGVGAVLAATPMRRIEYALGKWLSSTALLSAMVLAMMIGAALVQWTRAEDPVLRPLALVQPFVWVTLPAMALTAALALLSETVPGLGGGFGNVVWFFFWIFAMVMPSALPVLREASWDPLGTRAILSEMIRACAAAFPDFAGHPGDYSIGVNVHSHGAPPVTTFAWEGVRWGPALIGTRLLWLAAAAAIAALAALPFDRFAGAAVERARVGRARARTIQLESSAAQPAPASRRATLGALEPADRRFDPLRLALSEFRLLVAGAPLAWWLALIALQVPGLLAPRAVAARFAAVAWVWPVLFWSALGARDRLFGTTSLLDSAPRPIVRQTIAAWLAGAALAVIAASGFGLRMLLSGDLAGAGAAFAGAAFVSALALALGTWTGGRKTFEAVYVALWYAGPLNGAAPLDFSGGSGGAFAWAFAAAATALIALAGVGRARRLSRG
jgi:hypothetical protein